MLSASVGLAKDILGLDVNGFVDSRIGTRYVSDDYQDDLSLGELRFQLDIMKQSDFL